MLDLKLCNNVHCVLYSFCTNALSYLSGPQRAYLSKCRRRHASCRFSRWRLETCPEFHQVYLMHLFVAGPWRTKVRHASTWIPPPRASCIDCPGQTKRKVGCRVLPHKTFILNSWCTLVFFSFVVGVISCVYSTSSLSSCHSVRSRTAVFLWWLGLGESVMLQGHTSHMKPC